MKSEKIVITDETSAIENEIEKWANVYACSLFQKGRSNKLLREKNMNPLLFEFETVLSDELEKEPEISPRNYNTDSGSYDSNLSSMEDITFNESSSEEESSEHENKKSSSENNKPLVFDQEIIFLNNFRNGAILGDNDKKDFINRNQKLKPIFFNEDKKNRPEKNNNTERNNEKTNIFSNKNEEVTVPLIDFTHNKK